MSEERNLLSREQLEGMADLWARRPWCKQGACSTCDHHGTLEQDGRCLWCHGRERKLKARAQNMSGPSHE